MFFRPHHDQPPRVLRVGLVICLVGFVVLQAAGCVMRRTVKEGDEVVARGYVVKAIP